MQEGGSLLYKNLQQGIILSLEETEPYDCLGARGKEGNVVEKRLGAEGRKKFQKYQLWEREAELQPALF